MADVKQKPLPGDPTTAASHEENPNPRSVATSSEQSNAAETIQRNYRGYKSRRQMNGLGLDPSTRWDEAIKEARYQVLTRPRPHREKSSVQSINTLNDENSLAPSKTGSSTFAQSEWNRLRQVARRAHNDDTSDSAGEPGMSQEQLADYKRQKRERKKKREAMARDMGLEYWLEMVDQKHRHGSHLRKYHELWKASDTHDNFFYWLDEGEGRYLDTPGCSREVLDRDQVRYLSREERFNYLVSIDKQGRLRWAKNEQLVNTNYNFKDSMKGIVPADDPTPAFREDTRFPGKHPKTDGAGSSSESGEDSDEDGAHYTNEDLKDAKGAKKVEYVSAATVLNHLLRATTRKNTWIFVADTSFRLYIGIKQSGAFQHSSFLHGARISAAGLIKVKDGQLRSLSPLSGHYRPPTSAFRGFVHSLKEAGVDMSRVSISKSYAVLLGLEGYLGTKKRAKSGVQDLQGRMERLWNPDEAKRKADAKADKSESARREREHLERQKSEQRERGWSMRDSLGLRKMSGKHATKAGSQE